MLQLLLDLLAPTAPDRPDFKPNQAPAGTGIAPTATKSIANDPPLPLADALAPAHFAHPRANRRIALDGVHVAYELRRRRRRTIGFTVGADGLTVSAPPWAAVPEVEAALRQKARWVVAKLGDARERQARLQATRIDWRGSIRSTSATARPAPCWRRTRTAGRHCTWACRTAPRPSNCATSPRPG